jgi:pimeloyl-ACP methyl ester carboxylesterase
LIAAAFALVAILLLASACGAGKSAATAQPPIPLLPPAADKKCVVLLHGKGGNAGAGSVAGDVEYLRPGGNAPGWNGREWRYFPEAGYEQVRATVAAALDAAGCGHAVVQGFSNGAAAGAKLYCRGEDFGGRVRGYVVDDPVPDSGVVGCRPRSGVLLRLYWTGGLAIATDGWSCATQDWTCEGGRTIGIARYARELGADAVPSIHTTHTQYESPPEIAAWLAPALK